MSLALHRKAGESINMRTANGDLITITIGKHSPRTHVIIDAPSHVRVWRGELEETPRQDDPDHDAAKTHR